MIPFFSATKSSIVAAALFVLHKKTDLISAPASCVHLIVIIFFVYFKVPYSITQKCLKTIGRIQISLYPAPL